METPARMRTAAGVMKEIKRVDPDTEITLYYIRGLIHNEHVPVTAAGCKKLVNLDTILDYIARGSNSTVEADASTGGIRRVQV